MARGAPAQVALLLCMTAVLVVVVATALQLIGLAPVVDNVPESHRHLVWRSLMHTLDPGNVGGDQGTWTYLFMMLGATMGGIFVVSAFIGIINTSLEERLAGLRKGRSLVAEGGHTVILGFTPKIHTLLH